MLGVVGVACDLIVCPILSPKPVGIPEPEGLVCMITLGSLWDNYDWQLDITELARLVSGCNDPLAVQEQ